MEFSRNSDKSGN